MSKGENYNFDDRSKKKRQKATEYRDREYLYQEEIDRLIGTAKSERYGKLWHCVILLMYRHAYRTSELISLKWSDIDFQSGQIKVNRLKNGLSNTQPLGSDEIKALKRLHRDKKSSYVFISNQQKPLSYIGIHKAVSRIGVNAGIELRVHPHMIRHTAAIHFLERSKDLFLTKEFLGHKDINNTMIYLKLTPGRLESVPNWFK